MHNNKEFLGTESIGRLLLKLALPTVAAQLINMLYNIIDRIYIGHMPVNGDMAFTGVGVCMPIIMIVAAFAALISSGGAPRASIFMGKKELLSAEKTLGGCFMLQMIISFVLTAILCIWSKDLLYAFGASENTIQYAYDYMKIYALGTVFVQLTLGMNAFISAQGFTKTSMLSVLLGAVTNIALDPLFIYKFNMGVKGAALATIISQALSCAWILIFLTGKRTVIKLKPKYFFVSPRITLPCMALGSAMFIMQASESVIYICFNSSLLKYGGDIAVGTMAILTSVMQFAMLPLQGIAQGAQPILSYNCGAGNAERVKKTFRLLLISCLIYSIVLWTCVMIFPRTFAAIFTNDIPMLDYTEHVIRIYFGGMIIFGIQVACQMTFVSLGNALCSVIVAVVRKFVLLTPLIYIMPHIVNDAALGVYMAEPIADIIAVTFTTVLFAFQFKKMLKKIKAPSGT
ncbi:MAG: MATE family efflux transporter [Christensenellaceae bacterium]|nr:MATE family efflux transporter [Christensenellaceae bacterium]